MQRISSLSIILPAHNEEDNIVEAVRQALAAGEMIAERTEIIIVNDGSVDKTQAKIEEIRAAHREVRGLVHSTRQGYGAALESGIGAATGEYVFITDADLQFDLTELAEHIPTLARCRAILGYRIHRADRWYRSLNSTLWNLTIRILFGLRVRDANCAFKLFHRNDIATIKMHSKGALWSAELLVRLRSKKIIWQEVPVSHKPRTKGSPTGASIQVIARALLELIQLYFTYMVTGF